MNDRRRITSNRFARNRVPVALALVALFGAALASLTCGDRVEEVSAAGPGTVEVVASGLNNPRGLRVPAQGGAPEVFAGGFTAVIDVAFGPDGSLYVLEITKNGLLAAFVAGDWTGALVRVAPDGTRTEIAPARSSRRAGWPSGPTASSTSRTTASSAAPARCSG